ncbi:hypothetical protein [Bacillus sp. MUM 13]|uniref:hypothetical protein n=1 Tax=Bacillus sp. MUM 13 TaxID=1678001 RepID=UPI0008F59124|nr:hypothetical protein [Bacillus sp. MUM 13]OIK08375.1 hypothetical protein BIV59_20290 [Bacillus sp. MUM 13]
MNPYGYYPEYIPQPAQHVYSQPFPQLEEQVYYNRRPPQNQGLERRISALEAQNENQVRELNRLNQEILRLNKEILRINQEINRLNQNDEAHTRRLNRLNVRLRAVERNLKIPFTASDDGF